MEEIIYKATLNKAMMVAQIVNTPEEKWPLDEAIRAAEHSNAFAVFVDPTLWMKGTDNLTKQIAIMRALKEFRDKVQKVVV